MRVVFACVVAIAGCDSGTILDPILHEDEGCERPTIPTVSWTTDSPGTSQVEFGPNASYGYSTPLDEELTRDHSVLLVGLAAGQTWHWRAISEVAGERILSEDHTIETCAPDEDLPDLTVRTYDPTATELGWVVTSNLAESSFAIAFDRDGHYAWWERGGDRTIISRARLSRDGRAILYIVANQNHSVDQGEIVRSPFDGSAATRTRTVMSHHDFVELPSGNYVHLQADVRDVAIDDAGTVDSVVGDTLVEVEPDGTVVRNLFSVWDHFSPIGYVDPETDRHFYPQGLDWTHCNSIVYSAPDDAIFLSCKHISTVLKIDFETGDLVWRLGGDFSDFTLTDGDGFHGQHAIARTETGFTLFNNRADYRDENGDLWSEAVEFDVDESAHTYRRTWGYDAGKNFYTFLMGGSIHTPNGNMHTSWGIRGVVQELVPEDNTLVWDVATSVGNGLGYTTWIQSFAPWE